MSRQESMIVRKSKLRKISFISKMLFVLVMILILIFCIYIIDINAKNMLGQANKLDSINLDDIRTIVNDKIKEINEFSINIIKKLINTIKIRLDLN